MKLRSLALAGFLLLTVALGGLATATLRQSAEEQRAAASSKAALIAETIAQRINIALRIGVPLTQLTGIDALFAQYGHHDKDIIEISLRDASGTLLQHHTESTRPGGITARADIASDNRAGIRVEVRYAPPGLIEALAEMAGLVVSLSTLGGTLALCLLTRAAERGPGARARAIARMSRAICAGDFSTMPVLPRSCRFDRRPHWLALRMRALRESHARLNRLVASLVVTEPSASGRAQLLALHQHCEEGLVFTAPSAPSLQSPNSTRHAFTPVILAAASAAALRLPALSDSAVTIMAVSWLALGLGQVIAPIVARSPILERHIFPAALFGIVVLAVLPCPPIVRAPLATLLVGSACKLAPGRRYGAPLWLGDLVGALAAALIAHLAPEAPVWFSIGAAGMAALCSPVSQPNGAHHDHRDASTRVRAMPIAVPHNIVAGAAVALAFNSASGYLFFELLSLAACLAGACLTWQARPSTVRLNALLIVSAVFAMLCPLTQWSWCLPLACAGLSLAILHTPTRTRLASHVRWLSLATGAGLASTGLALGFSALDILAMNGLLCVTAVCAGALRTHHRG